MTKVRLTSGEFSFIAKLEEELAPEACKAFKAMLPLTQRVIHVRWSGEGVWIPFGDAHLQLPFENATSHPSKGEALLYPGGISEMEIMFAYGSCCFASKVGQLAGSHFLTICESLDEWADFGRHVLWSGAQELHIELI